VGEIPGPLEEFAENLEVAGFQKMPFGDGKWYGRMAL
jgi:hypothetical protein